MSIKSISDASFEQDVLKSKELVLVDFWAEWCGPCRVLAPTLEELAKDIAEQPDQEGRRKLLIMKLNIDQNPETPTLYGIRSIPTLMLFKDGIPVDSKAGALPRTTIKEWAASFNGD